MLSLDGSYSNSLGPPGTPLVKVAWTIIPSNFPVELQLKFLLWDPLGPPRGVHRGVPEGPKGSQRDPEEELRSVFKGKVARNNYLKNDFFQFLP